MGVALGDVNTAQVTDEDSALVLSAATHNAITLSDADAGSGNETLALSVSHGTLTLATELNLLVSGDGTDLVSLTGTVTDINAALDGLSYLGDHDYNGSDCPALHADDGGNTGSGGAQTADKIVPIVVDAVNDAPGRGHHARQLFGDRADRARPEEHRPVGQRRRRRQRHRDRHAVGWPKARSPSTAGTQRGDGDRQRHVAR